MTTPDPESLTGSDAEAPASCVFRIRDGALDSLLSPALPDPSLWRQRVMLLMCIHEHVRS